VKRRGPLFLLALAALVIVPGAVLVLAWKQRGAIVSAIGYAVRSAYSGNFGGKRTAPIDQVVIHTIEGTAEGALAWFAMPHGVAGPSSAHLVISQAGVVTRAVPDDVVAWHAANRSVNARSIGIENEGHAGDPATWSPTLMDALVNVTAELVQRYGIPVVHAAWDEPGVLGHADVPNQTHTDPGLYFPWDEFLSRVAARSQGVA
jgi:N-acetyl-anhydromuramyl-L-alanine amidase AmpD